MAGKRTIKDLDKDLEDLKGGMSSIAEAVGQLVSLANKEPEVQETPLQAAHNAEFGDKYKPVEKEDAPEAGFGVIPAIKINEDMFNWYEALAQYHGRTLEQEIIYMMKKTYISGRASARAEMSRQTTLSGGSK